MHDIVGFGLKSFRVSTKTIRILALVFYWPFAHRKRGLVVLLWFRSSNTCRILVQISESASKGRGYFVQTFLLVNVRSEREKSKIQAIYERDIIVLIFRQSFKPWYFFSNTCKFSNQSHRLDSQKFHSFLQNVVSDRSNHSEILSLRKLSLRPAHRTPHFAGLEQPSKIHYHFAKRIVSSVVSGRSFHKILFKPCQGFVVLKGRHISYQARRPWHGIRRWIRYFNNWKSWKRRKNDSLSIIGCGFKVGINSFFLGGGGRRDVKMSRLSITFS